MPIKIKQFTDGDLSIGQKHKISLHLAETMFGLPAQELIDLDALFAVRKKLYGSLYGATLNSRTGETAKRIRAEIEQNGKDIAAALQLGKTNE